MFNIFKNKELIPLVLVILVGLIFRFYSLESFPPSLNWDEVSHGYNSYSLLKTGADEWGTKTPLIFKGFGDYKLPLYIYLTAIPVFFFGLNAFAVRFISALFGVLALFGIYLLTNILWPNKKISILKQEVSLGLISSFLLAINPWHFFISRPALEANLSLTLIIFGFYFLVRGFQSSKSLVWSSLLLGLSMHSYNTARVFVPVLLLVAVVIFHKKIVFNKFFAISTAVFLLFFGVVVSQIISGVGTARYKKLQILSENTIYQIGQMRTESKLPSILPRLIYNRPVYFVETVFKNYLSYFSPQFLYQSKGSQRQFAIPQENLITLPVTVLFLIGLFILFKNRGQSEMFILSWLLVSPLAASLTIDPPQALRPNPLIPALIVVSVYGLYYLSQTKLILIVPLFLLLTLVSFTIYVSKYYYHYSLNYSSSWQYGYKEAINYIVQNKQPNQKVFFSKVLGEPHIFYAFFTKLRPQDLQLGGDNIRFSKSDWFWTDKIGDIYFLNDWQITNDLASSFKLESGSVLPAQNSLLVTSADHVPSNAKILKVINYLDGKPSLIITSIP